ncbi:hypothetical protein [Costertonia aggregata]|uniref:Nuclear transport factor 2 family protein n=1 Tax=Costertonia aggregata TaxID=343403 RepID=A0A7H9AUB6_9FLAO|nr:hypothetical protein [Costertonia aggregata]QLG47026.1 hypothetical protein HYG79_17250 [Costertonia aggregata]
MKPIPKLLFLVFTLFSVCVYTQQTSIAFESNGRSPKETEQNPFKKFIGEWTLKNDDWTQNWGNGTETIKIPKHHTISREINTSNSLLSIIDGPEPNGHIFWSYNPNTEVVQHLSSFGTVRAGNGVGTINENGDVNLKLSFEGEPNGTYRIYHYIWLDDDQYHMKSVQYDENDQPTGLFYEGRFVRVPNTGKAQLEKEIMNILGVLDDNELSIEKQLEVYSDEIIHMALDAKVIDNKESLKKYLEQQRLYGTTDMTHQIVTVEDHNGAVLMQGAVKGTFHPSNGDSALTFETKNLFVFGREKGVLKIKKIIYNSSPAD